MTTRGMRRSSARSRRLGALCLLVLLCVPPSTPAQSVPVEVTTSLSRSAVWIGDRFTYRIELRCQPGTDVLVDDLRVDRIRVDGAEVVAFSESHDDAATGPIRRVVVTLAAYRVDVSDVRIGPVTVRYYAQRGAASGQTAPAGEVTVPAAVVALRSTIPESAGIPPLRTPATLRPAPRYLGIARTAGLVLIAIAVVPVAIWTLDVGRHARRAWARRRVGHARQQQRASLDRLRIAEPGSEAARVEAFGDLDAIVREHLELTTGIPARALTPEEIRRALDARPARGDGDEVESLLEACERARYSDDPPGADLWTAAIDRAGRVLSRR